MVVLVGEAGGENRKAEKAAAGLKSPMSLKELQERAGLGLGFRLGLGALYHYLGTISRR